MAKRPDFQSGELREALETWEGCLYGAVIIILLVSVPLVLAWLASGRVKVHRGRTACGGCGYELEGLGLGEGSRCPECGVELTAEYVKLQGSRRYTPASLWITVPTISLLLVPTVFLVQWIVMVGVGMSWWVAALIVWPLYPVLVGVLVWKNLRQQRERAVLEARLGARREEAWADVGRREAVLREERARESQVRGAMVMDAGIRAQEGGGTTAG
jgi:hypothetical protein